MKMKNDVSFLVDNTMSFYEQQSTFNPNMPMRFLIYAGMVYSNYVESKMYHRFSYKQQKAPTPKCVCFYNGTAKKDDRVILKLSDAFAPDLKPDIEVFVTMININYGHNKELMDSCKPLKEYAWFVDRIRTIQKQNLKQDTEVKKEIDSLESAIDKAIDELSNDSLIKPFLIKNKAEVKHMCITEYDEQRAFAELEEDAREDGRIEGKLETALNLLSLGTISKEDIAKVTGFTIERIRELAAKNDFVTV